MMFTRPSRSDQLRALSGIALIGFALLGGCTLLRPMVLPDPLPVLDVQPPETDVLLRQRITLTYGERSYSFQTAVELHNDRMVIVGISSYSTTLFTIQIQGKRVHVEDQSDLPFDLKRFAADLQWSLFPRIPEQNGFSTVEEQTEEGLRRQIFRNDSPAGTVVANKRPPWSGDIQFTHPDGYTMQIKLISTRPLLESNGK